ncbi:hypothetical protein GPJ56_006414 [Histomonas meleagridis]|uniref:uncharacterized protein n=1 Tax=Histomonas meleagridis TaxID=135588 RepID=UPI003559CAA7|nr:hypothetical protein GPJ56_006414 [Histomonas meleagridis]KAH0796770.1 hypothetical protein GO595_010663 [Histomonas meleagridis]
MKKEKNNETGALVHLFRGEGNEAELVVLRKICMRYGIQSWDIMHYYLPWKNRSEIRSTLCKVLGKQAISEFRSIRADPLKISQEVKKDYQEGRSDIVKKGGILVNQKWDRSPEERAQILKDNIEKFDMNDKESIEIDIPPIMKVNFLQEKTQKRRITDILFRAALLAERAKRRGEQINDLKLENIIVVPGKKVYYHTPFTELKYSTDASSFIFDVSKNFDDFD